MPAIVADIVQLARLTGARTGELCNLRPCDINRGGEVWLATLTAHHGKTRVILIGPQAQTILANYLRRPDTAYCFSPKEQAELTIKQTVADAHCHRSKQAPRVANPKRPPGEKYQTSAVRRAIHRACCRAFPAPKGLDKEAKRVWEREHSWHPHQLRHSAGTQVRGAGGLDVAQAVLGHASRATTERYAELDMSAAIEIMKKIG
jgi:integrase